ncbi:glucuronate isomerase [Microlunatus antarcticus]|uniref:Uronate isomerase n=1 Tax=Microlunatus antarcticus TaxID=53388 RepID=A0A7W5P7U1_9ACTN|nr:glucuronate isomerase [Microlunatus antarcticus]MBB3327905.1 glucuronate isomerase [Microlunatus antarcticus]
MPDVTLAPHPDRLLPADPGVRAIARGLLDSVAGLPIISPHGHVPAHWLADDVPFTDPTSLLITPDHYVTRLLHADGAELSTFGVGEGPLTEQQARAAFRAVCARWDVVRGTPVRLWFEAQLVDLFGVALRPSAGTADRIYDAVAAALATEAFRPRALYARFGLEVLATTDDPCDDLAAHARLRDDPTWTGRVVPTFRPDRYLETARDGWNADVDRLGEVSGVEVGDYAGFVRALEARRAHFVAHGAVSTDHSHRDARTDPLDPAEASRLYAAARRGQVTVTEATALRRHLVGEMARMSCDDGLVMTLHPGVWRDHHRPTYERYGADVGTDIPVAVEYTDALRPMLSRYGTHPGFQVVLFTLDETVFSREIAPLAGFYPSVYAGAPWWFLDAPDAIRRYRAAITESAGFAKTSGFVDDTRAFCSIPARHDLARRIDAGFVAGLVAEHRLDEEEAYAVLHDLVVTNPRKAFKL